MAYRYCECGQELDEPTIDDELGDTEGQVCPRCGHVMALAFSDNDWLLYLHRETEALRKELSIIKAELRRSNRHYGPAAKRHG